MIPRDFCNWLKGYLEAAADRLPAAERERIAKELAKVQMTASAPYYAPAYNPYYTSVGGGYLLTNNAEQNMQDATLGAHAAKSGIGG